MSRPQTSTRTNLRQPLLSIAAESSAAETVLESFGVDYWFGGSHTLEEGCERAAVSPDAVVAQLCKLSICKGKGAALTAEHLIELILEHYDAVMSPLVRECGDLLRDIRSTCRHRDLGQTAQLFRCIAAESVDHNLLGRNHLYPYFAELETAVANGVALKPMKLASFWRSRMSLDHNDFNENIKELRRLCTIVSADLGSPDSVKQLLDRTAELQRHLHHHVLLEYQLLFPLSLQLEKNAQFAEEKALSVPAEAASHPDAVS